MSTSSRFAASLLTAALLLCPVKGRAQSPGPAAPAVTPEPPTSAPVAAPAPPTEPLVAAPPAPVSAPTIAPPPRRADPEPELLFSGRVRHGGYGAPEVRLSAVRGDFAAFVGAQGGWVLNHSLVIGLAGYGLATRHDAPLAMRVDGQPSRLALGYGGLRLAYWLFPQRLVHVGFGLLIGGGGVAAISKDRIERIEDGETTREYRTAHGEGFFVLEPEVSAELNVTSFMRLGLSFSYRAIMGVDAPGLTSAKLSAPSGGLALRFGAF